MRAVLVIHVVLAIFLIGPLVAAANQVARELRGGSAGTLRLLSRTVMIYGWASLLVGIETSDDAAVYRINDTQAIVATTDFFMPIVDDPRDFGAIAATNAISDVYAMGGTPLFALALVGMPINAIPLPVIREILAGGDAALTTFVAAHPAADVQSLRQHIRNALRDPESPRSKSASRELLRAIRELGEAAASADHDPASGSPSGG